MEYTIETREGKLSKNRKTNWVLVQKGNIDRSAYLEYAYTDGVYTIIRWLDVEMDETCIQWIFDALYIKIDGYIKYCVNINIDNSFSFVYECNDKMSIQDYCYYRKYEYDDILEFGCSINGENLPLKLFKNGEMIEYSFEEKSGRIIPDSTKEIYCGPYLYDPENHFPRKTLEVKETIFSVSNTTNDEMIETRIGSDSERMNQSVNTELRTNSAQNPLHSEKSVLNSNNGTNEHLSNDTDGEVIVRKGKKLDKIDKNAIVLRFANYYKDDRCLSFIISGFQFHRLKELVIGNYCQNTLDYELMEISDCEQLEIIKVGICSLCSFKNYVIKSKIQILFWLDLPKLKSIEVDEGMTGLRSHPEGPGDSFLELIGMIEIDSSFEISLL